MELHLRQKLVILGLFHWDIDEGLSVKKPVLQGVRNDYWISLLLKFHVEVPLQISARKGLYVYVARDGENEHADLA